MAKMLNRGIYFFGDFVYDHLKAVAAGDIFGPPADMAISFYLRMGKCGGEAVNLQPQLHVVRR